MPERTADLHTHTRFSDGTDTPQRVVELAKGVGLSALAITDHDNAEALAIAEPTARQVGIELVPGIEMSASADGLEVHLLAYFADAQNPTLARHLAEQKERRVRRVHEMVARLQRLGLKIEPQDVLSLAGGGTVGRPHVARALVNRGYVSTTAEAFQKYLGPNHPAFVPGSPLAPAHVLRVIRESGGIAVLAHPIYLNQDALIPTFVREGLSGLEVYHSGHTPEQMRHYERMADELKLLKTGGSDYHGDSKEGSPIGAVKIPYACLEALKQRKAAVPR